MCGYLYVGIYEPEHIVLIYVCRGGRAHTKEITQSFSVGCELCIIGTTMSSHILRVRVQNMRMYRFFGASKATFEPFKCTATIQSQSMCDSNECIFTHIRILYQFKKKSVCGTHNVLILEWEMLQNSHARVGIYR